MELVQKDWQGPRKLGTGHQAGRYRRPYQDYWLEQLIRGSEKKEHQVKTPYINLMVCVCVCVCYVCKGYTCVWASSQCWVPSSVTSHYFQLVQSHTFLPFFLPFSFSPWTLGSLISLSRTLGLQMPVDLYTPTFSAPPNPQPPILGIWPWVLMLWQWFLPSNHLPSPLVSL